jgi:hypothetical protein
MCTDKELCHSYSLAQVHEHLEHICPSIREPSQVTEETERGEFDHFTVYTQRREFHQYRH